MGSRVKEGKRERESVEDDGRSGHPEDTTAGTNVKVVHILDMCDKRRDMRSLLAKWAYVLGQYNQSLPTSYMPKVSARWVLQMLTDDQKRTRFDISRYLLSDYEDDPSDFIERVVTQDETWVHHFDPESKMLSKQWKHPQA